MVRFHRPHWRLLAGLVLALVGLGLGWLWFRDSSFARVERIDITGASSSEQARVRDALRNAAQGMSTLHLDEHALRQAVEPFTSVAGLRVHPGFPHKLRIEVLEHEPVARVEAGGTSVPATGGGLLLDGIETHDLPLVRARAPVAGGRVTDPRTLTALRVAAAAPPQLRARTRRLWFEQGGVRLDLRDGPELVFGSADQARTKWRAAARVLAEESAAGATYLDLRVPSTVAAGGVGAITPEPTPAPTVVPSNPQP